MFVLQFFLEQKIQKRKKNFSLKIFVSTIKFQFGSGQKLFSPYKNILNKFAPNFLELFIVIFCQGKLCVSFIST